ncbi:Alpha/Beta hydrolase protein [Protomyces lactucae-debilis]|uniref:Alpha/Beta hydrolase protein n=1 Tax=Protomyces lactucae-debilis TaxID=2754530 RepID=A0A1Y2F7K1_PROLT|nr:Alpha/Beta hydrolase protein [Protomyces lactucae-debilis]ORY79882.1 Alpha/Beta hydrolase protein [Protomyces lactucae-debilis]
MSFLSRFSESAHHAWQEGDYTIPIIAAGASLAVFYSLARKNASSQALSAATHHSAGFTGSSGIPVIRAPEYTLAHADYPQSLYEGSQRITTPYGRVQVFVEGPKDGPRVMLVHGITTPCPVFRGVLRTLVKRGYRVATYDLWGRGYTDVPVGLPMDAAAFSFQLLSVLAHLGWSDAGVGGGTGYTLVGYSLGGGIVAAFAACYPQGIRQLVMIAPAGLLRASEQSPMRKLVQSHSVPFWLVEGLQSLVVPKKLEDVKRRVSGDAIDTTGVLDWQKENHKGFARAYLSTFRSGPIFDQLEVFGKLQEFAIGGKFKVMAIWGAEDDIVDAQKVSKRLMEIVPAAELVFFDGIGHDICTAVPVEVAERIMQFVEQ